MLTKRRPVKARIRTERRVRGSLDFPQLRRDVMLLSGIGMIIRESRFYRDRNPSPLSENCR